MIKEARFGDAHEDSKVTQQLLHLPAVKLHPHLVKSTIRF